MFFISFDEENQLFDYFYGFFDKNHYFFDKYSCQKEKDVLQ